MKKVILTKYCFFSIFCISLMTLLIVVSPSCGSNNKGGGPPPLQAEAGVTFWSPNEYTMGFMYYRDPGCTTQSVSVTGPFIMGSLPLTCFDGQWGARISLGTSSPQPLLPLTYDFKITDSAGTRHMTATADCVWEYMPVLLAPTSGSTVTNPVTFSWIKSGESNIRYKVRVGAYVPPFTTDVIDASSLVLNIPVNIYGHTFNGFCVVSGPKDRYCDSWTCGTGIFTVQ